MWFGSLPVKGHMEGEDRAESHLRSPSERMDRWEEKQQGTTENEEQKTDSMTADTWLIIFG